MTEVDDYQSPREVIAQALQTLDDAFGSTRYGFQTGGDNQQLTALASGLRAALTVLNASIGECQVNVPYAGIQLVRHPDGSREWCCSHSPTHCDPA